MALTIKEIDNAKSNGKPYKLADGGGLCLLVAPSGAKLWRYRFDGKEKMMSFGEYPLVTLKDARELHFATRKTLAAGIDPMAERKAELEAKQTAVDAEQRKAEDSFENVARRWWEWWSGDKSPRHAASVMSRLEADVFPAYGHKHIDQITPAEIRNLMLAVVERGARDVAKRIHETSGQIFRYGIANGIAARNPAAEFMPRDVLAPAASENLPAWKRGNCLSSSLRWRITTGRHSRCLP